MASLATKDDLQTLSSEVRLLNEENIELKREVQELQMKETNVINRLDDLKGRSWRNDIIFKGLNYWQEEKLLYNFKGFLCKHLQQTHIRIWINQAYPIESRNQQDGPVIAHLPDDGDINWIMNNVKRFKGTDYVVCRNYIQAVRKNEAE